MKVLKCKISTPMDNTIVVVIINFKVFGLTRLGLEPFIKHTQGEHANHKSAYFVFSRFGSLKLKYLKTYLSAETCSIKKYGEKSRNKDNVTM
jgi:hypothetical protein